MEIIYKFSVVANGFSIADFEHDNTKQELFDRMVEAGLYAEFASKARIYKNKQIRVINEKGELYYKYVNGVCVE